MAGRLNIIEIGNVVDGKLVPDKNFKKDMVLKSYKTETPMDWGDWDDEQGNPKKTKMKDIFVDCMVTGFVVTVIVMLIWFGCTYKLVERSNTTRLDNQVEELYALLKSRKILLR